MKLRRVNLQAGQGVIEMHVLLADDHPEVLSALRLLVDDEPGLSVLGEVSDRDSLLIFAGTMRPDLVLLDWDIPDLRPAETLVILRSRCPGLLVIALSGRPEARADALRDGANAFVCKCDPPEKLLATLRSISKRGHVPPWPGSC